MSNSGWFSRFQQSNNDIYDCQYWRCVISINKWKNVIIGIDTSFNESKCANCLWYRLYCFHHWIDFWSHVCGSYPNLDCDMRQCIF